MFVRKNKSGSTTVLIIDKSNGYKILDNFGTAKEKIISGFKNMITKIIPKDVDLYVNGTASKILWRIY